MLYRLAAVVTWFRDQQWVPVWLSGIVASIVLVAAFVGIVTGKIFGPEGDDASSIASSIAPVVPIRVSSPAPVAPVRVASATLTAQAGLPSFLMLPAKPRIEVRLLGTGGDGTPTPVRGMSFSVTNWGDSPAIFFGAMQDKSTGSRWIQDRKRIDSGSSATIFIESWRTDTCYAPEILEARTATGDVELGWSLINNRRMPLESDRYGYLVGAGHLEVAERGGPVGSC